MDRRDVGVAVLSGVIFATIWSFSFLVGHDAVKGLPPILLVGVRLFLAGFLLWIVLRGRVNSFWRGLSRGERVIVVVSGFLSQGVYLGTSFGSLLTIPTSIANIVVSSVPMLMIPVAFLVLGERVRFLNVVAVVMGMVSESATWEKWMGGGLVTLSILIKTAPSLWRMVFDGNKKRREG